MATVARTATELIESANAVAPDLATSPSADRDRALDVIADLLIERSDQILTANAADLDDPRAADLGPALRDRLTLNAERVAAMADGVRAVRALEDPVGETLEQRALHNGLDLRKVRVPLGVIGVVYEARPNVTIDCAALTIKSGNVLVLRGSSYAERSNAALADVVREGLESAGLPAESVALLSSQDRESLKDLAKAEGLVDLLIPRGGEGLKKAIQEVATVPVMYAASGNCHVYVHADADLEKARASREAEAGVLREAEGRGSFSLAPCTSSLSSSSTTGGSRSSWKRRMMQEMRFFHPPLRLSPCLQRGLGLAPMTLLLWTRKSCSMTHSCPTTAPCCWSTTGQLCVVQVVPQNSSVVSVHAGRAQAQ